MKYEESAKRLNEIVKKLEDKSIGLDEAMELYKEGTAIVAELGKMLDDAEKAVTEVQNV